MGKCNSALAESGDERLRTRLEGTSGMMASLLKSLPGSVCIALTTIHTWRCYISRLDVPLARIAFAHSRYPLEVEVQQATQDAK